MLKMATMVCVEPIPMQLRRMLNNTTSQTALTGVFVYGFTLDQMLGSVRFRAAEIQRGLDYLDKGRASSRANA